MSIESGVKNANPTSRLHKREKWQLFQTFFILIAMLNQIGTQIGGAAKVRC
jgi:hypothetical protein